MKKVKILAVAPYEGMAETLSLAGKKRNDIDMTVKIGNLQEGLNIAKELAFQNFDVIISRGGTADLIRSELETPVVDAPLSTYDMLRSIKMAENCSGKFAIAGFKSITNCAHMLCDLLQVSIDIFTFESSKDVIPVLQSLKEKDYNLVVCDMIGSITAKNLGLNSILVPSGSESITSAIDEAVKLVYASRYLYKQKNIFQKALMNGEDDFLIFDPQGNIWFSTLTSSLFHKRITNMAQTYYPAFSKTDGQTFERQLDDTLFSIQNRHIFYDGKQYTLLKIQKKEALFKDEQELLSIYNRSEEDSQQFSPYSNNVDFVGSIQPLLEDYSKTTFPILITGEAGTGKDKAANIIYEKGPYHNAPFYVIDCGHLTERKWSALISSENSPLNNVHTTLYLKHVNTLTTAQLLKLYAFFEQSDLAKRNRLIFSMLPTEESLPLQTYLTDKLSCLLLRIPSLCERTEDIPNIATLYINELNTSLGRQIVGFEPDAMKLICDFSWPHNLDQLHRILKELVILTKSSYISAENVTYVLAQEISPDVQKAAVSFGGSQIDLHRTLDDITYDIICMTLNEEDMNKEKTAARLGISRSTLWRILKAHSNE